MLRSALTVPPWQRIQRAARGTHPARLIYRFSPAFVRAAWTDFQAASPRTRGAWIASERGSWGGRERRTLLLNDTLLVRGRTIFVRVWMVPTQHPNHFSLHVELATSQPFGQNARLVLQWGNQKYATTLSADQLFFEDISPPNFSRFRNNSPSGRLQLTFEFGNDRGGTA